MQSLMIDTSLFSYLYGVCKDRMIDTFDRRNCLLAQPLSETEIEISKCELRRNALVLSINLERN